MTHEKIQHYLARTVIISGRILLLFVLIRFLILSPGRVDGISMESTMQDGNLFLVNKFAYLTREPERFEVVDALDPVDPTKYIVKRVIGLPGERVIFKQNKVYIQQKNGAEFALPEPYLKKEVTNRPSAEKGYKIDIPDHEYVLLGDNRDWSHDSRMYGPLHRRFINGKLFGY